MGFWPFKREGGDVEVSLATRVVTAVTVDDVKLRGKLTVHFAQPRTRPEADAAADVCAFHASQLLSEAADHRRLLGDEEAIVTRLKRRLPGDLPELRAIELVSLHVVGDMPGGPRRPSLRAMRAVDPKGDVTTAPMRRPVEPGLARRPIGRVNAPLQRPNAPVRKPAVDLKTPPRVKTPPDRKAGSLKVSLPQMPPPVLPPPPGVPEAPAKAPPKRRPSAQIPKVEAQAPKPAPRRSPAPRAPAELARRPPSDPARRAVAPASRTPGSGTRRPPTPAAAQPSAAPRRQPSAAPRQAAPAPAALLWPRRNAACRDAIERIPEGASADELAGPIALLLRDAAARIYLTVALASDHENLDLMEAFEAPAPDAIATDTRIAMERLRREASACAAYLFYAALLEKGIPQNIAIETLQAAWMGSLPGRMPIAELTRYLSAKQTAREISFAAVLILSSDQDPAEVRAAMEPLLEVLGPEVQFAADVVKRAIGL